MGKSARSTRNEEMEVPLGLVHIDALFVFSILSHINNNLEKDEARTVRVAVFRDADTVVEARDKISALIADVQNWNLVTEVVPAQLATSISAGSVHLGDRWEANETWLVTSLGRESMEKMYQQLDQARELDEGVEVWILKDNNPYPMTIPSWNRMVYRPQGKDANRFCRDLLFCLPETKTVTQLKIRGSMQQFRNTKRIHFERYVSEVLEADEGPESYSVYKWVNQMGGRVGLNLGAFKNEDFLEVWMDVDIEIPRTIMQQMDDFLGVARRHAVGTSFASGGGDERFLYRFFFSGAKRQLLEKVYRVREAVIDVIDGKLEDKEQFCFSQNRRMAVVGFPDIYNDSMSWKVRGTDHKILIDMLINLGTKHGRKIDGIVFLTKAHSLVRASKVNEEDLTWINSVLNSTNDRAISSAKESRGKGGKKGKGKGKGKGGKGGVSKLFPITRWLEQEDGTIITKHDRGPVSEKDIKCLNVSLSLSVDQICKEVGELLHAAGYSRPTGAIRSYNVNKGVDLDEIILRFGSKEEAAKVREHQQLQVTIDGIEQMWTMEDSYFRTDKAELDTELKEDKTDSGVYVLTDGRVYHFTFPIPASLGGFSKVKKHIRQCSHTIKHGRYDMLLSDDADETPYGYSGRKIGPDKFSTIKGVEEVRDACMDGLRQILETDGINSREVSDPTHSYVTLYESSNSITPMHTDNVGETKHDNDSYVINASLGASRAMIFEDEGHIVMNSGEAIAWKASDPIRHAIPMGTTFDATGRVCLSFRTLVSKKGKRLRSNSVPEVRVSPTKGLKLVNLDDNDDEMAIEAEAVPSPKEGPAGPQSGGGNRPKQQSRPANGGRARQSQPGRNR